MKKNYLFTIIFSFLFTYSYSQISELPYSTSFEDAGDLGTTSASQGLTKWTSVDSGEKMEASDGSDENFCSNCIQWGRDSGYTPSNNASAWYTGPSSAQDGTYYIYIESSGTGVNNKRGKSSNVAAKFNFNDYENVSMTFWVHNKYTSSNHGPATGALWIYDPSHTVSANGWYKAWGDYSSSSNSWQQVTIDLSAYDGLNGIQFWFSATCPLTPWDSGSWDWYQAWQSDMALDNITVSGDNVRWIGASNADWSTATNWSTGKVPSTTASPIITNLGNSPAISSDDGSSGDVTLKNITVNSGATLTIDKEASLTLSGNYSNSGTVTLNSASNEFASIKVGGTSTGNITYNRWVNSVSNGSGWDLIGSPVGGLSISSFATTNDSPLATGGGSGSNQYAIGTYDNTQSSTSAAWSNYTTDGAGSTTNISAAGNFTKGKGYQMATDSGATLAFTGTIDTDATETISVESFTDASGYRWNLLSNPYPSYITIGPNSTTDTFLEVNDDVIDDTFVGVYGYDANTDNDGLSELFDIYNNASTAKIAPGQSFMVAARSTTAANITFKEEMQTVTGSDDFISGDVMENIEVELRIYNDDIGIGKTRLFFDEGLGMGLDRGWDAGHYYENAAIMTRLVEEDEGHGMAINAMGLDAMENAVIPLVINQSAGQEFRVNLHTATIPDPNVYLEDVEEGTFTNLYEGDFVYTPTSDLEGVGRFFIHMSADTMSNEDVSTSMLNAYKEVNANYITIEGLATQSNNINVSLYNILGRRVLDTTLNNNMNTQTISTLGMATGIYVIEVESGTDRLTKKLIIQ